MSVQCSDKCSRDRPATPSRPLPVGQRVTYHRLRPKVRNALTAPVTAKTNIVGTAGIILDAPLLPLLVLPSFWRSAPVFPFEVARAAESIVAVLAFFVTAVVEKVWVVDADTS